jgi:hypothetical protein
MKMKKMKKERRRKVMGGWYLMVICLMMRVLTIYTHEVYNFLLTYITVDTFLR